MEKEILIKKEEQIEEVLKKNLRNPKELQTEKIILRDKRVCD